MTPEKGKFYYVEHAEPGLMEVSECVAVTELGGVFNVNGDLWEKRQERIRAEAEAPKPRNWWQMKARS